MTIVGSTHLAETLNFLQEAGARESECVVLWIGRRQGSVVRVERVIRPDQVAGSDYFHIPPHAMQALMADLRKDRSVIAAQVHSHPELAFHSLADDRWAIVRHVGALSLVLPHFALGTSVGSFWEDVAVFELSSDDEWMEVPSADVSRLIRSEPSNE